MSKGVFWVWWFYFVFLWVSLILLYFLWYVISIWYRVIVIIHVDYILYSCIRPEPAVILCMFNFIFYPNNFDANFQDWTELYFYIQFLFRAYCFSRLTVRRFSWGVFVFKSKNSFSLYRIYVQVNNIVCAHEYDNLTTNGGFDQNLCTRTQKLRYYHF